MVIGNLIEETAPTFAHRICEDLSSVVSNSTKIQVGHFPARHYSSITDPEEWDF
jgi:hypothetical protein